jgi:D-serine deaminase-like pyridoxal phosphate-dependent protein
VEISELPTPCLILDKSRLETNAAFMRERANTLGVSLRPHMKTSKCIDVMKVALDGLPERITVSTLTEAEYFFGHGVKDITVAVGIASHRVPRIAALQDAGASITVILDSVTAAESLVESMKALNANLPLRVLIEVDCGDHRCGLTPDDPGVIEVAEVLSRDNTILSGVLTHAGQSYACNSIDEIRAVAEQERTAAVTASTRLRESGFEINVVSVGSTPTATHGSSLKGVTEMRPGVYLFGDLYQAGLKSLSQDRIALSVLSRVIGVYEDKIVLDAGGLALSKDFGANRFGPRVGFGQLANIRGETVAEAFVKDVSQEHGVVPMCSALDSVNIGDCFRIYPNHACMTAAAYDKYYVVERDQQIVDEWQRCNGWT